MHQPGGTTPQRGASPRTRDEHAAAARLPRSPSGRTPQWVLVQPFERRVLTYTPSNAAGWHVEMGNVGRHYYSWRYGKQP